MGEVATVQRDVVEVEEIIEEKTTADKDTAERERERGGESKVETNSQGIEQTKNVKGCPSCCKGRVVIGFSMRSVFPLSPLPYICALSPLSRPLPFFCRFSKAYDAPFFGSSERQRLPSGSAWPSKAKTLSTARAGEAVKAVVEDAAAGEDMEAGEDVEGEYCHAAA